MRTSIKAARSYMDALEPVRTEITGTSLTRQDQAHMVNINTIYAKTQRGEIVQASRVRPEYGDFSQVVTYDEALTQIIEAENAFMELPSDVRKKYNNDPAVYYEEITKEVGEKVSSHYKAEAKKIADEKAQKELDAARKLVKENPLDES